MRSNHLEKLRWRGRGRALDFLGAIVSDRGGGNTVRGRGRKPDGSPVKAGAGAAGAELEEDAEEELLRRRIPLEEDGPVGEDPADELEDEDEEERRRRPERLSSGGFSRERLSPERRMRSIISSRETGSTSASGRSSGSIPASRWFGRNAPLEPDSRSADGDGGEGSLTSGKAGGLGQHDRWDGIMVREERRRLVRRRRQPPGCRYHRRPRS